MKKREPYHGLPLSGICITFESISTTQSTLQYSMNFSHRFKILDFADFDNVNQALRLNNLILTMSFCGLLRVANITQSFEIWYKNVKKNFDFFEGNVMSISFERAMLRADT